MNEIQLFKHEMFGEIRTMTDEKGEPWFVGRDVAEALGYSNAQKAVRKHVDEEDKGVTEMGTPGGNQPFVIINESGLYSLILSSKLPSAKQFKRWVTVEVLPQIRKTGGYSLKQQPMSDMEILVRAVLIGDRKIKELEQTISVLEPKAIYCDEVLDAVDCMTTTQVAKELDMTVHELTQQLVSRGVMYWQSGQYLLYADYARRGYAKNRSHTHTGSDGHTHTRSYLVWTERGRRFIHNFLGQRSLTLKFEI